MRALLGTLVVLAFAAPAHAAGDGDVFLVHGHLQRVHADGAGLADVANPPTDQEHLAASPTGPIAYSRDGDDYVVRWIGTQRGVRLEGVPQGAGEPVIAPDGDRYAVSLFPNGVYVGTISGTAAPTQVSFSGEPTIPGLNELSWTPDGSELVGTVNDNALVSGEGFGRIGAVNADTGVARLVHQMPNHLSVSSVPGHRVEHADQFHGPVAVSPDGTTVAYLRQEERINGCPTDGTQLCEEFFKDQLVTVPLTGGDEAVIYETGERRFHVAPDPSSQSWPPEGEAGSQVVYSPSGDHLLALWRNTTSVGATTSLELRRFDPLTGADDALATLPEDENAPAATLVTWAPAATPIVFVHGFLGAKLSCAGIPQWPVAIHQIGLQADGVTDAGCAVTADGIVDTVLGKDIYGSTLDFLGRTAPGRVYALAWDWRKSPEQSLAKLDALVNQARAENGGEDVAILAHSMGGLLTRWYLDSQAHADKVARALIVATPSWGAPKTLFPLATGQETPAGVGGLDALLGNDTLKQFARNLAGAYFLYPSAKFGTWLTVEGRTPSVLDTPEKLEDYVGTDLSGNAALLADALSKHASILDGWKTNGVDVRAVAGTGMNTIVGVNLRPDTDAAELRFDNGDETVPARSATQGTPGTADPFGENIPIRYACGISHVPMASDAALTAFGAAGFLTNGDALTAPAQPCSNGGFSLEVHDVSTGRRAARAELEDIEGADVIRFPGRTFVVTNDATPQNLSFPAGTEVVARRLDGGTAGAAQTFTGPISLATAGGAVTAATPTPTSTPTSAPTTAPTIAPTAVPTVAPTAVPDRKAPKLRIKVRKRKGKFIVIVTATDPSGVRAIQFRVGSGKFRRYKQSLKLTRKQVGKLRIRATDHAGNTTKLTRAKLPA